MPFDDLLSGFRSFSSGYEDGDRVAYLVANHPPGWASWNWRKRKKYLRKGWLKFEWGEGVITNGSTITFMRSDFDV